MVSSIFSNKSTKLFIVLACLFITNALVAELIGGKIFSLEKTLGIAPFIFSLFGEDNLSFNLTAGVLLWPVVFIMTDIINEYYGTQGVRLLSYIAVVMIMIAFVASYGAIHLSPADWWVTSNADKGLANNQIAFEKIFGQGMWIIFGSIIAFLIGQLVDVYVFHKIKKATGEKSIWLRSTGSTLVSQLIDSFVVIFIAFKIGQGWSFPKVFAIASVSYIYKFVVAILVTPILYVIHNGIENYLGKETASSMKAEAMLH